MCPEGLQELIDQHTPKSKEVYQFFVENKDKRHQILKERCELCDKLNMHPLVLTKHLRKLMQLGVLDFDDKNLGGKIFVELIGFKE